MPYKDREKRLNYEHEYYKRNKEKFSNYSREYYIKNQDIIKDRSVLYRRNNKEKLKEYVRDKDVKSQYDRQYKLDNRERTLEYVRNKKKEDPQFKLQITLRNRLLRALKGGYKSGSAVRDLGCTIPELKAHLESQFLQGMSWDNYGLFGWHIDHKIPLAFFDLTDREQFLRAVHYTNLQPMWAGENIKKSNKIQQYEEAK